MDAMNKPSLKEAVLAILREKDATLFELTSILSESFHECPDEIARILNMLKKEGAVVNYYDPNKKSIVWVCRSKM